MKERLDKNDSRFNIVQLFMAKAGLGMKGFDRCFYGTVRTKEKENGVLSYHGKIHVKTEKEDCYLYSESSDKKMLGHYLDQIVVLVVDMGLHDRKGVYFKRYGFEYHMN